MIIINSRVDEADAAVVRVSLPLLSIRSSAPEESPFSTDSTNDGDFCTEDSSFLELLSSNPIEMESKELLLRFLPLNSMDSAADSIESIESFLRLETSDTSLYVDLESRLPMLADMELSLIELLLDLELSLMTLLSSLLKLSLLLLLIDELLLLLLLLLWAMGEK